MYPDGVASKRLYIVAEAADCGSQSDLDQAATRSDLLDILDSAASATGLDKPAWRHDDGGERTTLTIDEPAKPVVDRFVREVEAELFRYNLSRRPGTRLRVSVSVRCGQLNRSCELGGVVEDKAKCVT